MDYQLQSSKFYKEVEFTSEGIIAPIKGHKLYGERTLQIVVENVTPLNSIIVQCKISGSSLWQDLATIVGTSDSNPETRKFIDISKCDYLRFRVLNFAPQGGKTPKLIASGFFSDYTPELVQAQIEDSSSAIMLEILCIQEKILKQLQYTNSYLAEMSDLEIDGDL